MVLGTPLLAGHYTRREFMMWTLLYSLVASHECAHRSELTKTPPSRPSNASLLAVLQSWYLPCVMSSCDLDAVSHSVQFCVVVQFRSVSPVFRLLFDYLL